jgi:type I restriction enzyme S subunit
MRDGWIETSLGEIAEVIGGGTPSTAIAEYWDGDIVWLTPTEVTSQDGKVISDSIRKITDLGFKNSGAQMLPIDSVILTSRASVGYVALAGKDLCTNQGFQSLVPKHSVLSKFLMFWVQQNRSEFESRSAGSTFKEISKSNVKSIKLQLPTLPEQKRIVDLISSVDSYIETISNLSEKNPGDDNLLGRITKLRAALLSDLLSGNHVIPATYDSVVVNT